MGRVRPSGVRARVVGRVTSERSRQPRRGFRVGSADQLIRAVQATTDPTPQVLHRFAYAYDPAGNRLVEQIDDGVTAWTSDALNRLVAQAGGGVLQVEGRVDEPAAFDVAQAAPSAVEGRR